MISPSLAGAAFVAGLLAAAGIYAMLLVTLLTEKQLWPPGEKSWAYYLHWSLVGVFNLSLIVVTVTDWNSWVLPRPVTLIIGAIWTAIGIGIFVRGTSAMQSAETMGVTGALHTEGPYAYSRNPQYLGMIVGIAGFAVLVNSLFVALLAIVHIGWVLLLPRAEEPHLRAEYGEDYREYRECTPRFVDERTIRKLLR
ncbi:Protein-S-isoprenylcysteine O-methyltransferase Ste14 [Halogranum amylolyticum]|uniref:Protein-S-isoprenylcysteine O-methyltransferase Ste14 n=1 Tax=Halogranum amylolyticum TaxID=660520 RepID=A0A1H8MSD3_9EURY|nr:isoprenylcysteine carboxylmethyltransferase family protein [Halogranum amylolyticum]SEO20325.1 Protein-S-isoprenylcysteine O-methyltransferase Ste14 [Halogranum amylolyticum]